MTKNDLRVVVDVNVLVSALIVKTSTPRRSLKAAADYGRILMSREVVDELVNVVARPKFDKYVTEEEKTKFIDDLLDEAIDVEVIEIITDCRDAKDNKYLELAVSGSATHIITGDADLLVMNPFRGIAIVAPQKFLESIKESQP